MFNHTRIALAILLAVSLVACDRDEPETAVATAERYAAQPTDVVPLYDDPRDPPYPINLRVRG